MVNFGHVTVTNIKSLAIPVILLKFQMVSPLKEKEIPNFGKHHLNILKVWGGVVGWLKFYNHCHFMATQYMHSWSLEFFSYPNDQWEFCISTAAFAI